MYGLVRIRLAKAITRFTRPGADFGGISIPFFSSRAFGVGVHMSTSAGVSPPPSQFALAPAGSIARTTSAAIATNPALKCEWLFSKPISFVGLRG